jgi:hypothetical protein
VKKDEIAQKRITKDNFKSAVYLDEFYFIESNVEEVEYNKPSYIGIAILDLSKIYMIDFLYNYIQPKYKENYNLTYTDTDSFILYIETEDIYKDMYENKELFDLSDLTIDNNKYNCQDNKKALGKMKDEVPNSVITEFIALAPKVYSFITNEGENKKTAKGVQRAVLKKQINHKDYKDTLETGNKQQHKQTIIRSYKHQLFTVEFMKDTLSAFDSKVYRIDKNTGHPYGYNPKQ